MDAVVKSLKSALTRGTLLGGKISGIEPLSAGLKRVELAPIQKSMNNMAVQFRDSMPQAPASMAANSRHLAATTRYFLGKRSTSQPAQAGKSTNGRANKNVPQA